jgi:hypothetical protein
VAPTEDELERIEESNRLRRELLPILLIERVGSLGFTLDRSADLSLKVQG